MDEDIKEMLVEIKDKIDYLDAKINKLENVACNGNFASTDMSKEINADLEK